MRIFKIKPFHRWARKHALNDDALIQAADEVMRGLVDASLGGHLYKKRIGTRGRGKRGSVRTLLTYRLGQRVVFLYAFEKNQRDNIDAAERKALQTLGRFILDLSDKEMAKRLDDGSLIEVEEV